MATGEGGIVIFLHVPSMLIVFGGTIAVTLMNFPLENIKELVKVTLRTYRRASHGFIYDGHPNRKHLALRGYRAFYRFLCETDMFDSTPHQARMSSIRALRRAA